MIFVIFVVYLLVMTKADTILELFKTDERKAFQLLYDTYFETLVLFANQVTGDAEAAEDIVQDCFVKFWMNKPFVTLPSGLDKYVFQAVKFSSLNYTRGDQRKRNLHENVTREMMADEEAPGETETDMLEMVYRMVDLLPEERRNVFLMVFVDGMSYQEVANKLQISKNTVKTQLSRSLKFLRETLKERYNSFLLYFLLKK